MQQHPGHLLHLFFDRFAVPGDRQFHWHRGVFVDGQPRLCSCQQDDPPGLGYADNGRLVVLVEQLLNGQ